MPRGVQESLGSEQSILGMWQDLEGKYLLAGECPPGPGSAGDNREHIKPGYGASLGAQWWGSTCQYRRHGFNPWSGKIPHVTEQLTPCTTAAEPVLWSLGAKTAEPTWCNYWRLCSRAYALQREEPLQWEACTPQQRVAPAHCREISMQQQRPSKAISSVQSLSHVRLFETQWMAVRQASLSITDSWSLLQLMSIESVMPSNHLVLSCPLLLLPSIFPSIRVFSMSRFFASGGVSASASVFPMNFQDWFPLGWTGWISLQSKGFSRVFSKTTVQKHQFFSAQLSLYSNSHIHLWLLEKS